MKNFLKTLAFFLFIFTALHAAAQDTLTLQNAIQQALKKNYGIQIARNDAEIAENNVTWGNAGALPTADLVINQNSNVRNVEQLFITGQEVNRPNAHTNIINSGIALNWTVFDGFRMFIAHERLKSLQEMGELQSRLQIENTVAEVTNLYYNVVQQQQRIRVFDSSLVLSAARLQIAKDRFELGGASRIHLLQAQTDFNFDRSLQLLAKQNLILTKAQLLEQIGITPNLHDSVLFYANQNIPFAILNVQAMEQELVKNNTNVLLNREAMDVATYQWRESKSLRYPRIGVTGGYDFNRQTSDAGFLVQSRQSGYYYGITAALPLFNGLNVNRQIQNNKLLISNAELELREAELNAKTALQAAFQQYRFAMQRLDLEEQNLDAAKQNADLAMEVFRYGSITNVEFRDIQMQYVQAENRVIEARFNVKQAETELLRVSGRLQP